MSEIKNKKNVITENHLQSSTQDVNQDDNLTMPQETDKIFPEGYAQLMNFIDSKQNEQIKNRPLQDIKTPIDLPSQILANNSLLIDKNQQTGNSVMPQNADQISTEDIIKLDNLVNSSQKSWGNRLAKYLEDKLFWIHNIITICFYILITFTILFSVFSVAISLWEFIKNHDETSILKVSEHMFLSLLPIFIIFGFYNYYKNNTQNKLIGKSFPRYNDESSVKTMNLTKTLFLSSIISYAMIKTIEVIFLTPPNKEFNTLKVLLSLVFLAILMIYFILFDRKPH